MRSWIWLSLVLAFLAAGRTTVAYAASEPTEMIQNGGFEKGDTAGIGTGWWSESWGSCTVQFDLTADKAQSGKYCQHVHVDNYKDGAAQIRQMGMHVTKGKPYSITLWMRGNLSVPVTVGFRKHDAPYTLYLKQEYRVSPAWQRFTITGSSSETDEDAGLYLSFSGGGDLWIDSVSARPDAVTVPSTAH